VHVLENAVEIYKLRISNDGIEAEPSPIDKIRLPVVKFAKNAAPRNPSIKIQPPLSDWISGLYGQDGVIRHSPPLTLFRKTLGDRLGRRLSGAFNLGVKLAQT
jgi:hypothetical protein